MMKLKISIMHQTKGRIVCREREIEATRITEQELRGHWDEFRVVYACPDYWALGEGLIVYEHILGGYFYAVRPCRGEKQGRRPGRSLLEAKGCSLNLKMPDPEIAVMWEDWLKQEAEGDVCVTPRGSLFWVWREEAAK